MVCAASVCPGNPVRRAVLEGGSPALAKLNRGNRSCVSMALRDNPAAVIMVLLKALDEKTRARIMPTLLKKNPLRQQLRGHSLNVLNAVISYRHVLHCKRQAPRRQGIS